MSETFESLRLYIDLDLDGLQQAVLRLLGGGREPIDTGTFGNDVHEVNYPDDVLTLLAHLGYLAFEPEYGSRGTVRTPNEEVRLELQLAAQKSSHEAIAHMVRASDVLLRAVWNGDAEEVASGVSSVHDANGAPLFTTMSKR